MFKYKRTIAQGLLFIIFLWAMIVCGFSSWGLIDESSEEIVSESSSEDTTLPLLEEIDRLNEVLVQKENELNKAKKEKEELEKKILSLEQEHQAEMEAFKEEVYELIEANILGFERPEPQINLIPIKSKSGESEGNIIVQVFDNNDITYLQQRTWFFYEVLRTVPEEIPNGIRLECLLAMAFTEGGAGIDGIYIKTNNLFGLGASSSWKGLVYDRKAGVLYKDYETAKHFGFSGMLFRAYPSIKDSIEDYILVMQSDKYKEVLNTTSNHSYLKSLYNNDYCNNYSSVEDWLYIIKRFNLKNFILENQSLIDFLKKL